MAQEANSHKTVNATGLRGLYHLHLKTNLPSTIRLGEYYPIRIASTDEMDLFRGDLADYVPVRLNVQLLANSDFNGSVRIDPKCKPVLTKQGTAELAIGLSGSLAKGATQCSFCITISIDSASPIAKCFIPACTGPRLLDSTLKPQSTTIHCFCVDFHLLHCRKQQGQIQTI
jgi:hypothetical protein